MLRYAGLEPSSLRLKLCCTRCTRDLKSGPTDHSPECVTTVLADHPLLVLTCEGLREAEDENLFVLQRINVVTDVQDS